jgi:hypothetical protein
MKKIDLKKAWPVIAAIVLFIVITMVYFNPLLQGKQLKQGDIVHFQGMSKEIADYRAETGKEALWTNSMFGGMPAYQISVVHKSNLINYFDQAIKLWLPHPAGLVFLYFLGFYILLLVLGVDKKLGIIGAIAFALSSYFLIILEAGHNSKANAIGYMAPVIAGIILSFRGKYLVGGILTALFLALEINANHLQITYYLMLIVVILGITEFFEKWKENELKTFFKAITVMIIALIISIGVNIGNLWTTYEYGQYSTRGKSELTNDKENKTAGLDKDYATDWSYGKIETFSLLIPNYMGGGSQMELSKSSDTYKVLKEKGIENSEKIILSMPTYWGPQSFTSGNVYAGAIMIFLFIMGLFLVKGKYKWWLVSATILSLFLAWGKHFMWFTDIFFDYIPGYNKFRAVSMTLVIAEFCIPLLGMLALKNIFDKNIAKEIKLKAIKYAGIITLGVIVLFGFFSGMFLDFVSQYDGDKALAGYFPDWLLTALQSDRHNMLLADSFRSFAYIAIAGAILWLFVINKLKNVNIVVLLLAGLVICDMWLVDKRFVNTNNFETKTKAKQTFAPSKCDEIILTDKELDYRVLNLSNPFNDAMTSYFHKSIGGYHGAKLKRYKELIDSNLDSELQLLQKAFSAKSPDSALFIALKQIPTLNMLNTKYIIYNPEASPIKNSNALGNAWFVNNTKLVANADSELAALASFNPAVTAIVDKRFESIIKNKIPGKDTNAVIKLTEYKPNFLKYSYTASTSQMAVFSEIYYEKGWKAYIDGKEMPYFRADYVLRAMEVPAGLHEITWKFEPDAFYTGEKVSLAFNILLILGIIGGLFVELKRWNKKDQAKNDSL